MRIYKPILLVTVLLAALIATPAQAADPNQTVPTATQLERWRGEAPAWLPDSYVTAVTGAKTGTTKQILNWAADKWDWPRLYLKAQAWKESGWDQSFVGDEGHSFGIMQLKDTSITGSFPLSRDSTAFNVDVALAILRAYADGALWIPADPTLWPAIGAYYAGNTGPDAQPYIRSVQINAATRPWRHRASST